MLNKEILAKNSLDSLEAVPKNKQIVFGEEKAKDILNEMMPIFQEHYEEIAKYKDIPLLPDYEMYLRLEAMGKLKVYTCRDVSDNSLAGYAVYLLQNHYHYQTALVAQQDILYIRRDFRGRGAKFILWCDKQLKDMSVQIVTQHVKVSTPKTIQLMQLLGYEAMDMLLSKRLDK